jgi:hypothetical protein
MLKKKGEILKKLLFHGVPLFIMLIVAIGLVKIIKISNEERKDYDKNQTVLQEPEINHPKEKVVHGKTV